MTEWPRMRAAAEAEGFGVIAWWSPWLSVDEAQAAARRAGWTAVDLALATPVPEECLAWVGRPNHFPYSRVGLQGRVHAWPIWGVLPDHQWVESLQRRRHGIEQGEASP